MSKVKKEIKLAPEQYWEWRTTIEELNVSRLEFELKQRDLKIKQLEVKVSTLLIEKSNAELFLSQESYKKAQKDYDIYIQELEKNLGTTVKNKIIDPITYEIKEDGSVKL